MLVLSRKVDEQILIGDDIKITVVKIRNNQIRLGISAPRDVRVLRGELAAPTDAAAPSTGDADSGNEVSDVQWTIDIDADSELGRAVSPGHNRVEGLFAGKARMSSTQDHLRAKPLGNFFTAP